MAVIVVNSYSQQGQEAFRIACQSLVKAFDSQSATVQQMQQYASCVNTLYSYHPEWVTLLFKVAVVIAIISPLFGLVQCFIKRDFNQWGIAMLVYGVMTCVGLIAAGLTIAGLHFVFAA